MWSKEGTSIKEKELMNDIKKEWKKSERSEKSEKRENEDFTIFQLYVKDGRKIKVLEQ